MDFNDIFRTFIINQPIMLWNLVLLLPIYTILQVKSKNVRKRAAWERSALLEYFCNLDMLDSMHNTVVLNSSMKTVKSMSFLG